MTFSILVLGSFHLATYRCYYLHHLVFSNCLRHACLSSPLDFKRALIFSKSSDVVKYVFLTSTIEPSTMLSIKKMPNVCLSILFIIRRTKFWIPTSTFLSYVNYSSLKIRLSLPLSRVIRMFETIYKYFQHSAWLYLLFLFFFLFFGFSWIFFFNWVFFSL